MIIIGETDISWNMQGREVLAQGEDGVELIPILIPNVHEPFTPYVIYSYSLPHTYQILTMWPWLNWNSLRRLGWSWMSSDLPASASSCWAIST